MSKRTIFLTTTMVAGLAAWGTSTAFAQQDTVHTLQDNSNVVLSGTVAGVNQDEFVLNYGSGTVTVEMDDWDFFKDKARALVPGETVTVTGHIDDDLFEGREVEADTVYVHDRFTYYYQDTNTDLPVQAFNNRTMPNNGTNAMGPGIGDGSWISATGLIENVNGQEFTLNTGHGAIKVDTDSLGYNPMNDEGFRRLTAGDRVYVSGVIDDDFFEQREIKADSVVKLSQNKIVTQTTTKTTTY
jgi:uncharacterized protein YdeI (BOF family)